MTEHLGAGPKNEPTIGRVSVTGDTGVADVTACLTTRIGAVELEVPRDRESAGTGADADGGSRRLDAPGEGHHH